MRFAGRITEWNDEKGFGFVVPHGGGTRAFVHTHQFQRSSRRPAIGDLISYLPVVDARGRTNAQQIRHAGEKIELARRPSRMPRAALGIIALALGATAAAMGLLPLLLFAVYLVASGVSYLLYAEDKSAARYKHQRTPENTLHLADLLGGWPGALIAQQRFHHKTLKQPFQSIFWMTVVLNLVGYLWLMQSGLVTNLVRSFSG